VLFYRLLGLLVQCDKAFLGMIYAAIGQKLCTEWYKLRRKKSDCKHYPKLERLAKDKRTSLFTDKSLKWCLHYGVNRSKLGPFLNEETIFLSSKRH
jgi:hypothetical protein